MKKILLVFFTVLLVFSMSACKTELPEETFNEPQLLRLDELTEEEFKQTLKPYLEAYNDCVNDTLGVEFEKNAYLRYYKNEDDAMTGDSSLIVEMKAVTGISNAPDGLFADPAYADCYPVTNFASLDEVNDYFGKYIDTSADFYKLAVFGNLIEYDGKVYLVRGARGYGTVCIDTDSAALVNTDGYNYSVKADRYLFGEKEATPTTLTFTNKDDRLLIISAEAN